MFQLVKEPLKAIVKPIELRQKQNRLVTQNLCPHQSVAKISTLEDIKVKINTINVPKTKRAI